MGSFSLHAINPSSFFQAFRKQNLAIGLDIGSHAIKICELVEAGRGYHLNRLGSAVLPANVIEDGVLQDPAAVARVIAALMNNLDIKGKKVAISISGYSVIVKKINLAVMSEKDLEGYIMTEAEQYIPFDIDDVYLDYQDLKTGSTKEERTDVMLAAAKRDVVDGFLEMLKSAGLQAVVVDVDAFALENSYAVNYGTDENVALIDIGASKMNINVLQRGTSVLARDIGMGGRQLTEQIQNRFDLAYEEAEAIKTGVVVADEKLPETEQLFAATCAQWATEIKRALDFYYSNHPEEPITRIAISGGGARIKGLGEFLQHETGIDVELFNPFAKITVDAKIDADYLQAVAPEMALCVGLATRPVEV